LNGIWTSIASWSAPDNNLVNLTDAISTPINFASAIITGIALTANPVDDPGNDTNFQSFVDSECDGDRCGTEKFTFNTVTTTPLPGALALFGSVLFGGIGVSTWRKRRGGRRAISVLA
jgi:hypothetical protein